MELYSLTWVLSVPLDPPRIDNYISVYLLPYLGIEFSVQDSYVLHPPPIGMIQRNVGETH